MNDRLSSLTSENSQNSLISSSSQQFDNSRKSHSSSTSSDVIMMHGKEARQAYGCCFLTSVISLCTVSCGFLACIVVLFCKLIEMENQLSVVTSRQRDLNRICVPCAELQLGPFEEDNQELEYLEMNVKDGIVTCCAKNPNQTTKLLDLVFQKRQKIECAKEILHKEHDGKCNSSLASDANNSPISVSSAHLLVGLQLPSNSNGKGPIPIRNWSSSGPVAHASGLILKNDRVKINTSGLYFLYSQMYFMANFADGIHKPNESLTIFHYVYRFNVIYPNGGEQLLLKSVRTECWAKLKEYSDFTSYTGGSVKLNAGDEIYVKVSDVSLVSRDPKASFLGMFKIP